MKLYLIPATVDTLLGQREHGELLWVLARHARACGDLWAGRRADEWAREIGTVLKTLSYTQEIPEKRFDPPTGPSGLFDPPTESWHPVDIKIEGACLVETDRGRALELAAGLPIIAIEPTRIRSLSLVISGDSALGECELIRELREPKEEVGDESVTPRQDPS